MWLAALLGAGLWVLATTLGPPGIGLESSFLEGTHYELAFLGALLGGAAGISFLARLEVFLQPAGALLRVWARLVTLLTAIALGCLLLALPPLAMHSPVEPLGSCAAVALGVLHLSSIGLVAHTLPLRSAGRPLLLVGAVWLLPAILGGRGGTLQGLAGLLEVSGTFQLQLHGEPLGPQLGASLASILVWVLLAGLIELRRSTPSTLRLHALRNSG